MNRPDPKTPVGKESRKEFLSPPSQTNLFGYDCGEIFKTPGSPSVTPVPIAKRIAPKRKIGPGLSSISFDCQDVDRPDFEDNHITGVLNKHISDAGNDSDEEEDDGIIVNCSTIRASVEETWNPSTRSTSTINTDTKWNDFCIWGEIWSTESPMVALQSNKKSLQIMTDGLYKIKLSLDKDHHKEDDVYLVLSEYKQISKQAKTENLLTSNMLCRYMPPKIIPAKCLLNEDAVYLSLRRSDRLQLLRMKSSKDEGKDQRSEPESWFVSSSENRDDIYPSLRIVKIV